MCNIEGCERRGPFTRGMCQTHYSRWRLYGSTADRPLGNRPQCARERMALMNAHRKPARIPECHPERRHRAHGLCNSCYNAKWNKEHPDSNSATGWKRRNPERARAHSRRLCLSRVGTTPEAYEVMWERQAGKCANTGCAFTAPLVVPDFRRGLQVDHCHRTGLVRGLLCPRCNTALGHVDDDSNRLAGLITYLDRVASKASAA